uniref:Uncharacterized protein n=1 Tax=Parascaris univalens TaxID=6257 RepID=A0A915B832_PARUN
MWSTLGMTIAITYISRDVIIDICNSIQVRSFSRLKSNKKRDFISLEAYCCVRKRWFTTNNFLLIGAKKIKVVKAGDGIETTNRDLFGPVTVRIKQKATGWNGWSKWEKPHKNELT